MRILVIPDIHLKTWIFDRADKILKDGDYFGPKAPVLTMR